jgi:DNA-binding transcriptional MerR regulator
MTDGAYTLADLCGLADVTPRTVRYYIAQGLLRSPGTTGPGARYDDGHLARLRLIRLLQREHLPLAEIRARLAAITDEEAIARAEGPAGAPVDSALDYVRDALAAGPLPSIARPAPPAPAPGSARMTGPPLAGSSAHVLARSSLFIPQDPPEPFVAERSHWERHILAADVELHVRRPLTRSQNRAVARLIETARQILEEDQP